MEFPGVIIKATWYFYWWSRKNCGISKGLDFRTFSGWSFVLSVISRGEIRNLRIPGFSKKYVWNSRNTHANFSWVMIFDLWNFQSVSHKFTEFLQDFQKWKLVFSGICKDKSNKSKIFRRGERFRKVYPQTPFGFCLE